MRLINDIVTKTVDRQMEIIGGYITNKIDEAVVTFTNTALGTASSFIQVAAAGALMYVFYHSIKMMFFRKEDDVQRIIFGYMIMLFLRIGAGVVEGQMIIR